MTFKWTNIHFFCGSGCNEVLSTERGRSVVPLNFRSNLVSNLSKEPPTVPAIRGTKVFRGPALFFSSVTAHVHVLGYASFLYMRPF